MENRLLRRKKKKKEKDTKVFLRDDHLNERERKRKKNKDNE